MKTKNSNDKPLVGFFPLFYNLSETGRAVLVAKKFEELGGNVIFFSHGGDYEYLAENYGFKIIKVKPYFTDEALKSYKKVLRGEKKGPLFPENFVEEAIKNEIDTFKKTKIKMLVSTHNYFSTISARAANVFLVGITTGPGFFEKIVPDYLNGKLNFFIPKFLKIKFANWWLNQPRWFMREFNKIGTKYKVKKLKNQYDLFNGDITLVTNFLEFINIFPNQQQYPTKDYIGIIVLEELFKKNVSNKKNENIENKIKAHLKDLKKSILVSMGSSGDKKLFLKILKTLNNTDYQVVAILTNIIDKSELPNFDDNILRVQYVPSIKKIHEMVDLSIIHGGQGTVYTAAYAGKPVIGFPMQFEQHLNLEKMVGHGAGVILSKKYFDEKKLIDTIENIFKNYKQYYSNSQKLAKLLPEPKGDINAANRINEILHSKLKE